MSTNKPCFYPYRNFSENQWVIGGRASRSTTPPKKIHNSQFIIGRLGLCCRAGRSTSYLFTFLLFYLFTLKHCCPVKTFSYGFREAGPPCETHCKPRNGAAVGGKDTRHGSPKGDLCYWLSVGCVSPASRNIILSCCYTHSCAAPRLAVGFV